MYFKKQETLEGSQPKDLHYDKDEDDLMDPTNMDLESEHLLIYNMCIRGVV